MSSMQKYMITGLIAITFGNVSLACDAKLIEEVRKKLMEQPSCYTITKLQEKDSPYIYIRANEGGYNYERKQFHLTREYVYCTKEKWYEPAECSFIKLNTRGVDLYLWAPEFDDFKCKLPSNFYRLLNKSLKKQQNAE